MDWSVTVLVVVLVVIAFAVFFTLIVLRHRGGSLEVQVSQRGMSFKMTALERRLAAVDAAAAAKQRGQVVDESDYASATLGAVDEVRSMRCLWVDDNPLGNVHERRMLERVHVQVELAVSTNEAIQHLIASRYDLLITDLTRPGPDGSDDRAAGLDLLTLLASTPGVPPVLVYASDPRGREEDALKYGARAVLTTPVDLLHEVLDIAGS
jgi:CheY-like chemotaxis protein